MIAINARASRALGGPDKRVIAGVACPRAVAPPGRCREGTRQTDSERISCWFKRSGGDWVTPDGVERFLTVAKVAVSTPLAWRPQHPDGRTPLSLIVPVEVAGVQEGELRVTAGHAGNRLWTFMLHVDRKCVLRWDLDGPPHRNPPTCALHPGVEVDAPHEHRWNGEHCDCAVHLSMSVVNFHQVADDFAMRANLALADKLPDPPPFQMELPA